MREEMMQARLAINAVVLVLSAGVSVQTATACSKEAVAGAVDRWTTVLAENNPDTIVALYSKDAVLWGTLSSTVRSDPAGLKAYFVGAFQALGGMFAIYVCLRPALGTLDPPQRLRLMRVTFQKETMESQQIDFESRLRIRPSS